MITRLADAALSAVDLAERIATMEARERPDEAFIATQRAELERLPADVLQLAARYANAQAKGRAVAVLEDEFIRRAVADA